jgi:hypothetical protein
LISAVEPQLIALPKQLPLETKNLVWSLPLDLRIGAQVFSNN